MKNIAIAAVALGITGVASADIIQIDIVGQVDFGGVNIGQWADVNPGDSAVMSFQVDSDNFVDSTNFPTRGYEIIQESFVLTLDGISGGMANPYPNGATPYFIIRDNDPAVDGFFLAEHPDQFPIASPPTKQRRSAIPSAPSSRRRTAAIAWTRSTSWAPSVPTTSTASRRSTGVWKTAPSSRWASSSTTSRFQ